MKRIAIYPKDIMLIIGRSDRYCRQLHRQMKIHYKKEKHQPLTISEFSQFMGIKIEEIETTFR